MLKSPDVPRQGYRLAMHSRFRANPLIDPLSHHYVVKLVLHHPLMATDRMECLLRSHLLRAYEQARVAFRSCSRQEMGNFEENLQLSVPQERKRCLCSAT